MMNLMQLILPRNRMVTMSSRRTIKCLNWRKFGEKCISLRRIFLVRMYHGFSFIRIYMTLPTFFSGCDRTRRITNSTIVACASCEVQIEENLYVCITCSTDNPLMCVGCILKWKLLRAIIRCVDGKHDFRMIGQIEEKSKLHKMPKFHWN